MSVLVYNNKQKQREIIRWDWSLDFALFVLFSNVLKLQ
jgi:hypothetical protein